MGVSTVFFATLIMIANTNAMEENDADYEEEIEETVYDYEELPAKELNDDYEVYAEEKESNSAVKRSKQKPDRDEKPSSKKGNQVDHDEAASKREHNNYVRAASRREDEKPRTLFHEQGLKGPHSYRYGYDTGGSKNRMTKYEERDNEGNVKGSYSFRDPHGKIQTVNYEAHPKYGFRASGSFGTFPRRA